jgi:hypothetical protein
MPNREKLAAFTAPVSPQLAGDEKGQGWTFTNRQCAWLFSVAA